MITQIANDQEKIGKYYTAIGFKRNPFETNTAEREPEIELYAVRPPYLDPVEDASKHSGSYTLAGTRGSGKSATRITVQRTLWKSEENHPLPIALTNFSIMRGESNPSRLLNLFSNQVFFLTIEAALVYLTTLPEASQEELLENIEKRSRQFLDWSIKTFYLSRPQDVRTVSAQECFDIFSVSFGRRSKIWAEKRWDAVTASLVGITASIAKKFDIDIGDTEAYKRLLASCDQDEIVSDPLFILKKSVEFARLMGFSGLLIQVDKIDETDWTTNDAESAARLVWPLYSNVQLHEIDGLAWSFFLWDRVRELLNKESNMPVRWDKLPNDKIKWDPKNLQRLVEKRLDHFSEGRIDKLQQLFDGKIQDDGIYPELFSVSGLSPRMLVTVLNAVLTNHIHSNEGNVTPLTAESLAAGLDSYVRVSILDDYSRDTVSQLKKLGMTTFVTKDVARAFTIGQQGARQKIEKWINSGLAIRNGQVFAGERSKPVDQFIISELRAKRLMERQLELIPV